MKNSFIKYITRDYSLRDRSMIVYALLKKGTIKEIFYTATIEHRHDGVVDVYIQPKDNEDNTQRIANALAKDKNYIESGLELGIKVSDDLLRLCKRATDFISKEETIKRLEEARDEWVRFSSFLEFTHRVGSMGKDLTEKQLKELGEFHEKRKLIFLEFFEYLDKLCLAATGEDKIERGDLRFLTFYEIVSYLEGKINPDKINRLQERRKAEYVYENNKGKEKITDLNTDKYWREIEEKSIEKQEIKELSGIPVTKGKITGEVIVVSQADFKDKQLKDKIVVISMTTTSMNNVLKDVKAIVTEEGGLLCHAAIFSREFGIITLTQVKNATKVLKDGDIVEVDADKGVIRIIK
ncbi:MAG: PEP-utilizing enzyme [Candidatus Paceibacterota bacterium]|jgi:pyruvate,water dikinase